MKVKAENQRVGVFIDVQNLYHTARHIYKTRVKFGEVLKRAVAGRKLIRAFAYVIGTKGGEEQSFFNALTKLGIETRIKPLKEFYGGAKKADWDVGLVVDAIRVSTNLDTIVLVSGDGDFAPLVDYLRNRGKRVEVIGFGKTTSSELKEASDEFIDLQKNHKRFIYRKKFYKNKN